MGSGNGRINKWRYNSENEDNRIKWGQVINNLMHRNLKGSREMVLKRFKKYEFQVRSWTIIA